MTISNRPLNQNKDTINILYHGSDVPISGGIICAHDSFTSRTNEPVKAVFATSDKNIAMVFAVAEAIRLKGSGYSYTRDRDNKLYFMGLKNDIKPNTKVYLYSVDSAGFIHDKGFGYYLEKDAPILSCKEFLLCDVLDDIEIFEVKDGNNILRTKKDLLASNTVTDFTTIRTNKDNKNGRVF